MELKYLKGVDEPLVNPLDDCLDRQNFAKRIFTLIDNTPLDTHLRVGILGDWGSGKTTAMNFIKYYCQDKGHPIASFHPWQFRTREEAWKGFVASLDRGLTSWRKISVGDFERKKVVKKVSAKARKLAEISENKIARAIGVGNILNDIIYNMGDVVKSRCLRLVKLLNDMASP